MKWIFENRVYSSLEEISGKTMSEANKPQPFFSLAELKFCAKKMIECMETSKSVIAKTVDVVDFFRNFFNYDLNTNSFILDVGEGAESESEL